MGLSLVYMFTDLYTWMTSHVKQINYLKVPWHQMALHQVTLHMWTNATGSDCDNKLSYMDPKHMNLVFIWF